MNYHLNQVMFLKDHFEQLVTQVSHVIYSTLQLKVCDVNDEIRLWEKGVENFIGGP